MEFTGERYLPSLKGQINYEHFHRYVLSLEFAAGKSVLDLASGEGYGSALMARVAKSVTGVDIDPEAVEQARQQYANYHNLNFLVGACKSVPLPAQSVDVVVSFETIEHHDKHQEMMREIKRVLRPQGALIISSPDRLTYSDEPNNHNPFHVKELYYDEFVDLLNRYFQSVQVYGQKFTTGSFIFPLRGSNTVSFKSYVRDGNSVTQETCRLRAPIYFVAVCSDGEIDSSQILNSVYIDNDDDMLRSLWGELAQMQAQLQQAYTELGRLKGVILGMESSRFWKLRAQFVKIKQFMGLMPASK